MNWLIRFKNPVFVVQVILSIFTPILAYFGLTVQDMTTWSGLGCLILDALKNPYVVVLILVSLWNTINDPSSSGVTDSASVKQLLTTDKEK